MKKVLFPVLVLLVLVVAGITTASAEKPAETQPPAPEVEQPATPEEAVTQDVEGTPDWLREIKAQSGTITCYVECGDGSTDSGTCVNTTLAECCQWSHVYGCKFNGGYESGYCTDGSSSLTC